MPFSQHKQLITNKIINALLCNSDIGSMKNQEGASGAKQEG
jgi:hypothetical protein